MSENFCYHCHEPVPAGVNRCLDIDGEKRFLCCAGCEAVTRLILDAGLEDFYRFRSAPAPKVETADKARWQGFDEMAVLDVYAPRLANGERELRLQLDNLRCAACGWLVEKTLAEKTGVGDIRLNSVSGRMLLRWKQEEARLSDMLAMLESLGFKPHPLREGEQVSGRDGERRRFLKRLAVAGLGMMQVMMYGVAMYIGAFEDMDPAIQQFLRYISLLIATPVVLYSAAPFFRGAWRDLVVRRPGMDVPVALAIGGAYVASVWHTFAGAGEVYFDSVSMFVFFLLIGRYVELMARHDVVQGGAALAATLPAVAERIDADGETRSIPLTLLHAGDRVRVRTGDTVPADGRLLDERAALDEALLSGESAAVQHTRNENIPAGAINRGGAFMIEVTRVGRDTFLSGITRLLENAQVSRPRVARVADRLARWFVAGVLLAAGITALAWSQLDPARAFEITLSVLVVTCPCALALAVPVALTAATGTLAERGLLTVNSDALESLHGVTDIVFDKTGTLTRGAPRIRRTVVLGDVPEDECLALAAGLEAHANHPIAEAFRAVARVTRHFAQSEQQPGLGIKGKCEGVTYRIGAAAFALPHATLEAPTKNGSWVLLSRESDVRSEPLAWFEIEDSLRAESAAVVAQLKDKGFNVHLFSGDTESTVMQVAARVGIASAVARLKPEEKLARVRALQDEGRRVLMIGDGINDSPVLAGADVSIAMGSGAALAQSSADFVLAGKLAALPASLVVAGDARRIMRQNLGWAAGYNLLALPLAAAGLVAPWMAAIGMSASSLLVTVNALRIRRAARLVANAPEPLVIVPATSR